MSTSTNLQSKTALITGGSKGIGLGIAEAMARQHMKVAITSRHFDEAQAAAKHLISLGAESALAIECDVRDFDAQQNACLLYTSPSPRDGLLSRMPSSA